MSELRTIYCRTRGLMTPVIRARFWSAWSHCGILTPDDTVIEATFWHGVREIRVDEFIKRASKWEEKRIACDSPLAGIAWARSQIGKRYDILGALGIGLNRKWQSDRAWFCSEFLEQAVVMAGRLRFLSETWRIDPQMSYNVA